jgi:type IV pilus assembly protein PilW
MQDETSRLQDSGRFAIESIARAIRQAAYENWDANEAPVIAVSGVSANLAGFDARSLKESQPGIESPVASAVNGSDVLAVRFFGSGTGQNGDGTVLNCGGFGVPAPVSQASADDDRGWSIFYVAADSGGEPELRCKYQGKTSWTADALVRGVESFQVLYGVDTDGDGSPNSFMNADGVNALDEALVLEGDDAAAKTADRNRKTYWKKIVAVKIALLLRGGQRARSDALSNRYDLFGSDYANAEGGGDKGTTIMEKNLAPSVRNRLRKVFSSTIQLRNQPAESAA